MRFCGGYFFPVFVLVLFFISACELINPEEDIPAYINIDTVMLHTNRVTQGDNTHRIKDVWVDVDGVRLGTFEVPVRFPVLAEGSHRVLIMAGIWDNGIEGTRDIYPFYSRIEFDTVFTAAEIIEYTPVFHYSSAAKFDGWREDFESTLLTIESSDLSDTSIVLETDPSDMYNQFGAIYLTDSKNYYEAVNKTSVPVPTGSSDIYLELDYKTNNEFIIGLIINYVNTSPEVNPIVTINPKDEWNKIYINMTSYIKQATNPLSLNFYIRASKAPTVDEGQIYIDNIKLVNF